MNFIIGVYIFLCSLQMCKSEGDASRWNSFCFYELAKHSQLARKYNVKCFSLPLRFSTERLWVLPSFCPNDHLFFAHMLIKLLSKSGFVFCFAEFALFLICLLRGLFLTFSVV